MIMQIVWFEVVSRLKLGQGCHRGRIPATSSQSSEAQCCRAWVSLDGAKANMKQRHTPCTLTAATLRNMA